MSIRTSIFRRVGFPIALAAALLLAVGVLVADHVSAATAEPGWQMTTIDANAAAYDTPQLDGDYVVYRGPSQNEVFLYQISTGTKTKINTSPKLVSSVSKHGRYVAWSSSGVWVYDIVTGGPAQQVGMANAVDVRTDWGRIIWKGVSAQDSSKFDIYVHNIPLSSGYSLGRGAQGIGVGSLSLDSNYMVWEELVAGDWEIMLYNFGLGTTTNLTVGRGAGLADKSPHVADGIVVWAGEDGSDTEIFMYDCASGVTRQLTNDSRYYQDPITDGRWIAYNQGLDLWLIDGKAANPAASAKLLVGTGLGNSSVYYKDLADEWLVCSGVNRLRLFDTAAGTESQVSVDAYMTNWSNPQTDGRRIVAVEGNTTICLFEKASVTTTTSSTTTTSTTTTTTLPTTTTTTSSTTTTSTSLPSTTTTTLPGGQTFWDVPPSHPYYEAIEDMADDGVIGGYPDGSFGPSNLVMRQQFAKMIVGTLGFPCSEADICPFWDVTIGGPTTLYPDNYVAVAAQWNITNGIGGGQFGPYRNITRAQMITMVVRAAQQYTAGLKAPDAGYSQWGLLYGFNDPTHGYNAQMAEFNGLLVGIQGSGSISTWIWQPATRGEVAQILWNLSNTPGIAG